jgi:ATP-binding cassette subfamily C exporter for protease/lipase
LPNGFDAQIGAGGRGVSAGQAQRIALGACALFRDPAVLVFDEPNAHLDADGEAASGGGFEGRQGARRDQLS